MSEQEYQELFHYSELFSRDPLQRSELVTMAWKEGVRLGKRRAMGLMKSVMHFRAKELNKRSAFPVREVGKSSVDAWNHERVYIDRSIATNGSVTSLAEFLLPMKITPLDYAIANDFMESLTADERLFLDDLTAGFTLKEIKDLAKKKHLIVYEKSVLKKTKGRLKRYRMVNVEDVAPLITLKIRDNGRKLTITPNPILVDQIDSYFVLKPLELFMGFDRAGYSFSRFIEFLLFQWKMMSGNKSSDGTIRISWEALAWQLGFDAKIAARKKSEIREQLVEFYIGATEAGYLTNYELDQPATKKRKVEVLTLNLDGLNDLVLKRAKSASGKSKISYSKEQEHDSDQ